MSLLIFLNRLSSRQIGGLGALLIGCIGIGDFLVGPQISTAIFYVIPTGICAWYASRKMGIAAALAASVVWLVTEIWAGPAYSHYLIPYWNGLTRMATFLIIAVALSGYRRQLAAEEALADTDSLTGALNGRAFYEKVEAEIERARRFGHPFSLAYFDLDNFKQVNDSLGHIVGDQLLRKVVDQMKTNTRVIDAVARLGGDEFALLFPETGAVAAEEAVAKLRNVLLAAMNHEQWPVTFSIGLVTCEVPPENVKQVISLADGLMYSVKKSGKNRIAREHIR